MKHLLLILSLLLLASPARADDTVTSWGWNSVTGTFQALTRALGWKSVPDQEVVTGTGVFNSGAMSSGKTITFGWRAVKTGKVVVFTMGTTALDNSVSGGAPNTGANMSMTSPIIPAGMIPDQPQNMTDVRARDGSDVSGYRVQYQTDGTVTLTTAGFTNWSTSGQVGFFTFSNSWTLP